MLLSTSVCQLDFSVKDLMSNSMSLSKELLLTNNVTKWEGKNSVGSLPNFEIRNMIVEVVIVISVASQDTCVVLVTSAISNCEAAHNNSRPI